MASKQERPSVSGARAFREVVLKYGVKLEDLLSLHAELYGVLAKLAIEEQTARRRDRVKQGQDMWRNNVDFEDVARNGTFLDGRIQGAADLTTAWFDLDLAAASHSVAVAEPAVVEADPTLLSNPTNPSLTSAA